MNVDLDKARSQVERILSSTVLETSEIHRQLFAYLAERTLAGEARQLKEYTVGVEVFGKPASYDPRNESVVRMHVSRLRQKLLEYKRTEGEGDSMVVDLPKGGFALTFEYRVADAAPSSAVRVHYAAVLALFCVFVGLGGYATMALRRATRPTTGVSGPDAPWSVEVQQLWAPVLSSDRPLIVAFANGSTGASDVGTANAAFVLGQFFGHRKRNLFPTGSDGLSMGEIAMSDVVFVGPTASKPQIQATPQVESAFVLTGEGVRNVKPNAGEPTFLKDTSATDARGLDAVDEVHALLSSLPGRYGNGSIFYLEGNQPASVMGAVQAVTDPNVARTLVARLRRADGTLPRYYQIVLSVKAMDDTPVKIAYVLHRELTLSKPQPDLAAANRIR